MVQLPGEQPHKTKQNFLTHIITRSKLLRNTKKHPNPPPPPTTTTSTTPTPPKKKVSGIRQIYSGLRKPLFSLLAIHSRFCDS